MDKKITIDVSIEELQYLANSINTHLKVNGITVLSKELLTLVSKIKSAANPPEKEETMKAL